VRASATGPRARVDTLAGCRRSSDAVLHQAKKKGFLLFLLFFNFQFRNFELFTPVHCDIKL
jgi:hypothetical protein